MDVLLLCYSIKVMDPNSSVGKTCLGENVIELSSEKAEGHRDWNSPEYQDTSNSGGKKETKAFIFHKIETDEASDRYVAPCFFNRLEAYGSEINLGKEENMISNEFAVKLCLDHEVKCGHKVVKKVLIIALRGEVYFVKLIINLEEEDVEPGVVLGRSFMRLTKGIADFGNGIITIYPELDPFLDGSRETENTNDEWDFLIDDLNFGDVLEIEGVEIPPFVYKMKLDGEIKKEKEEAIIKVKGEALIDKEDPEAFEPGREEVKNVNIGITMLNHSKAEPMGLLKDVMCQVGVTTIIVKFLILDMPIDRDTPILVGRGLLYTCGSILNTIERITSTFDGIFHQTFRAAKTSLNTVKSDNDDEEDYGI
ncbi:hypothetical protein Tco_0105514 [Tanacetum coccineum]